MSKLIDPDVLDLSLDHVKQNADEMRVSAGQPNGADAAAKYADLLAANKTLVNAAMTPTDMTLAPGTVGSAALGARKIQVAAKSNQTVDNSGNADHVSLCDSVNGKVLLTTTTTPQSLTAATQVDLGAWEDEIREPT